MSNRTNLLIVKGMIASMPDTDQKLVFECADRVNEALGPYGKEVGLIVLALITSERALVL